MTVTPYVQAFLTGYSVTPADTSINQWSNVGVADLSTSAGPPLAFTTQDENVTCSLSGTFGSAAIPSGLKNLYVLLEMAYTGAVPTVTLVIPGGSSFTLTGGKVWQSVTADAAKVAAIAAGGVTFQASWAAQKNTIVIASVRLLITGIAAGGIPLRLRQRSDGVR